MSKEPVKFYWACIGNGNAEPVAVRGKKGARLAFTIGCPDPFEVDSPDTAIKLFEDEFDEMVAPLTPKEEAAARRREKRARALMVSHSYAGFGRAQS